MRAISYRGELVAVTTRARVYLAPDVAALPAGDPKLRFVAALCLYGRDIDTGEIAGPYCSEEAELYARCLLVPDDEFVGSMNEPDQQLAKRFRVPVEEVGRKRLDVAALPSAG